MIHYMNLRRKPFDEIGSGRKTIELRLYDEKRQCIRCGDEIHFTCSDDPTMTLCAHVNALHIFKNFTELYEALPLDKCGYAPDELSNASAADMEVYYSLERQAQYGVVGIELTLL